jgi:hypothetical protein
MRPQVRSEGWRWVFVPYGCHSDILVRLKDLNEASSDDSAVWIYINSKMAGDGKATDW